MKSAWLFLALAVMLGGCAGQQNGSLSRAHRSSLMKAHIECIYEKSIDAALNNQDFLYIQTTARRECSQYENMILETYPAGQRLRAYTFLNDSFEKSSQYAAALSLDVVQNIADTNNAFLDCTVEKTIANLANMKPVSREDIDNASIKATSMCYDQIMVPVIGMKDNSYSRIRKRNIVERTSKANAQAMLEMVEKYKEKQRKERAN